MHAHITQQINAMHDPACAYTDALRVTVANLNFVDNTGTATRSSSPSHPTSVDIDSLTSEFDALTTGS
jgi:hypothetical protein